MRPLKLSLTAFGPFVKTEVIDFEALGDKPLFLINGATGSGKTTILDAICFALYGQTTGKEREPVQMRCDYADDNLLTEVEFSFELAAVRYRIKRVPEQYRAKLHGEGTTRQMASAELVKLEGGSETLLVARKVSDATAMIEDLTGLQVDQFRQVMVLPQGQFRELLMADSKSREQIFSQLFETHIYKRIEDKLKAQAKTVYIKVEKLKDKQRGILESAGFETREQLDKAIIKLKPEANQAKLDAEKLDNAHLNALQQFNEASSLAKDFEELEKQRQNWQKLAVEKETFSALKKQVELAEQAQKIVPSFKELARCKSQLEQLQTEIKQAEKAQVDAKQQFEQAEKALQRNAALETKRDQQKQKLQQLKSYEQRVSKLQQLHAVVKSLQQEYVKSKQQLEISAAKQKQSKQQFEQGEQQKLDLEKSLAKDSELALQYERAERILTERQKMAKLEKEHEFLSTELHKTTETGKQLKDHQTQAEQAAKALELAWHRGQAAILARDLEQDQPCPVCGSKDHPKPAESAIEVPTDLQREEAQQKVESAQKKVVEAREKYQQIKTSLDNTLSRLNESRKALGEQADKSIALLQSELQHLVKQLEHQQNQQKQLAELNKQLVAWKKQDQHELANRERLTKNHIELKTELHKQQALLEEAQNEIPERYRDVGELEKEVASGDQEIQQLDQLIKQHQQQHTACSKSLAQAETSFQNLQQALAKAETEQNKAYEQWQLELIQSCFDNEQAYKEAQQDEATIQSLKVTIADYDKQRQTLKGALQQQKQKLKDQKQPDLPAMQLALEGALAVKNKAQENWKMLDSELIQYAKAADSLNKMSKQQVQEEQQYKVVGTLSSVANGQTGNKISLQRFVLSVLLDDVLIEASHRLKVMSKGRYLLLRKEDRAKGNKASGLELEVEDNYTGKLRAVSTLSGGESFMASLSLALGLSDVVQAYAGGIRLDTLFIDEGFGSLDADSLDLAIRTLIDLRNSGRMIGIISHVSELREQIPLRLDVEAGRNGNTIKLVN